MVALLSCLSLQDIQISQRVFVTHSGKGCESGILWMFQMTRIQMRRAQCRHGVGGLFAHSCQQSRVFDRTGAPAMCCKKQKTHRVYNFVDVRNFALHAISQILIPIIFAMTKFAFAIFHHVDTRNFAHTPRIKRQVLHLPQICNAKFRSCLICNARDFTSS